MKCQIKALTGLNCPGCGLTRMTLALLHGEWYQAFRYNPWFFTTIPGILVLWLMLFKKHRPQLLIIMRIYCYSTVAFGILRNIPMFSYLLPTKLGM